MTSLITITEADDEQWLAYNALATRSYGHPVGDITRLRHRADIRVAVQDGEVIAGGLGLLAPQLFGGAPVPSALLSAGCVAPERRGDRLSVRMLTERLRPLRDQGAVISTLWTTSNGYVRHLGFEAPVPVFAWSVTTDDLKKAFTGTPLSIEHGHTKDAEDLQRRLAHDWNGPVLRPDWWPAWMNEKNQLTTYRFTRTTSTTGVLAFTTKRAERHGTTLTVHDFWAADEETAHAMMAFLARCDSRVAHINFRRSALPPYPTLLHKLHRFRPTAEAWHPWMLRILDLEQAVRLRGWPRDLTLSSPIEIESENGDTWDRYVLEVRDGEAQITPTTIEGDIRLTRGQLAVWYAGGYRTSAAARLAGVVAPSDNALTALIRAAGHQEPWLPEHF